jgi:monoamine oxidase
VTILEAKNRVGGRVFTVSKEKGNQKYLLQINLFFKLKGPTHENSKDII